MSKLRPRIIRTIITTTLIAITSATHAQQAPPAVPSSSPKSQTPAVLVPTTTPTKQDLKLLSKAAGIFLQTDRSEIESKMKFSVVGNGITADSTIDIKTIVQTGGKFRSQLTLTPIGSNVTATYVIVSNGANVWIHRPDRNEYAKTTFAAFGDDKFWIGISASMFLSIDEKDRKLLISSLGTDQDFIVNLDSQELKGLQLSTLQIDGVNSSVFSFDVKGSKMKVFLLSESADLQKVEFADQKSGSNVTFLETIIRRSSQVNITDRTFTFTPPKGTKKVKSIKIAL